MVLFNYSTRELTAKIVYYGPGLCGKTTNLQYIHDNLSDTVRGKMLSLATKTDRTLFFDFLPMDLGEIRGMRTRMQLYTVPGQVFYNETRKLVLKGVDGLVFVADSQKEMLGPNVESFKNLEENLKTHGLSLAEIPHVIQFNKRDLPKLATIEELNDTVNKYNAPFYESVATTGIGVQDSLKAITKLVLLNLTKKYEPRAGAKAAPSEAPAAEQPAPAPVAAAPAPTSGSEVTSIPLSPDPLAPPAASTPPAAEPEPMAAEPELAAAPAEPAVEMPLPASAASVPMEPAAPTPTPEAPPIPLATVAPPTAEMDEDTLDLGVETPLPTEILEPAAEEETFAADAVDDLMSEVEGSVPVEEGFAPEADTTLDEDPLVRLTEVVNDHELFEDPSLEVTRLDAGQSREIVIPVQVERDGKAVARYKLSLTLRLDPLD